MYQISAGALSAWVEASQEVDHEMEAERLDKSQLPILDRARLC